MLLVMKIVYVVFAAVMVFFPKRFGIYFTVISVKMQSQRMPCSWHIVRLVL